MPGSHAAAIGVGPLVRTVPQELVQQVAVGPVDLDAIETRSLRIHRPVPELADDGGDLVDPECTGDRDHLLGTGRRVDLLADGER